MKIPLRYNIRSITVRRLSVATTVIALGLSVAVVLVLTAMIRGIDLTFIETGNERNVIVIREGAINEVNGYFSKDVYETVRLLPDVRRDAENKPQAVGELVLVVKHRHKDGQESNLMVRGVSAMSFKLRPEIRLVQGRSFREGRREIIVSKSLANRFKDLAVNRAIEIHHAHWMITGLFEADAGAHNSEIWASYQDVADAWNRPIYSSILLSTESPTAAARLSKKISDDRRIQLKAISQKAYYAQQTVSSAGLKALTVLIALIMGIGSCFAVMNMMYSNVMSRQQEVAIMRIIGFRKYQIVLAFIFESLTVSLMGWVLGCSVGPLINGYSAHTPNFVTWSEIIYNFSITPGIVVQCLAFALLIGLFGGLLPARRAASLELSQVLRG